MTLNPFQGVELSCINEEDLQFDPDIDRIMRESELDEIFRSFGSLEEYNQEFVVFFKAHRREFLIDYSQRDGHFRV
jgi:HSP20 family molecular chaperone IbpA